MKTELRERYVDLVNYLGLVLGPSYEITLHDLSMGDKSIIAIANGHITNRNLGSPLTSTMLELISSKRYEENKYEVNYVSLSMGQKALRSSTIYIKDKDELVGLLCITFDDSKYKEVSNAIMSLCHPDILLNKTSFERLEDLTVDEDSEIVTTNIEELVDGIINKILKERPNPNEKIKKRDRVSIVRELKNRGVFLVKGSILEIAKKLNTSEATIYRYLNEIEENDM